jgi:phage terminase large subunit GpA-like protein
MSDLLYLEEINELLPDTPPPALISDYVQGRRMMPQSTPFPGPWDNARTPYLTRIMDAASPSSPFRRVVAMKGAQIGMTAAAENIIAYYMDAAPTEILYVSATQDLLEKWASKRLEPLITSLGFRHKISMTEVMDNAKSRRSGDKTFSKQFIGGALDMASAQSAASLRSDSKKILVRDECDAAPAQLKTGEGNWMDVSKARTNAWGARARIIDLSTPTTEEASNIWQAYLEGDQCLWMMKCPHCGHMQNVSFNLEKFGEQFLPEHSQEGRLEKVGLRCQSQTCNQIITEGQKREFVTSGDWIPTFTPAQPGTMSVHIPTAMSLMMTWVDLYLEYKKTKEGEEEKIRSFTNLYLGLPYKEKGTHPELDAVGELRMDYAIGTAPQGVIYTTMGADVQHDRVEIEALGVGEGYRTWSLDYRIFDGPTDDAFSGAWEALFQAASRGDFVYTRVDGVQLSPRLIFIDSGDAQDGRDEVVQQFCQRLTIAFPSKGHQQLKVDVRRHEKGDIPESSDHKKYRATRIGESDRYMYIISTNHYKKVIYNNLSRPHNEVGQLPAGGCGFPRDYPDEYFLQLTSEERRADGSYHKIRTRNEALDTRVYALAASDVWLDNEVKRFREWFVEHVRKNWKREPTADEMNTISYTYVLYEINKRQTPVRQIK